MQVYIIAKRMQNESSGGLFQARKTGVCVLIPARSAHCVTGPPLRAPENCLPRLFHGGAGLVVVVQVITILWEELVVDMKEVQA